MFVADVVNIQAPALPGAISYPVSLGGRTPNGVIMIGTLAAALGAAEDHADFSFGCGVVGGTQWAIGNWARDNVIPTQCARWALSGAVLKLVDAALATLYQCSASAAAPNQLTLNWTTTVGGGRFTLIAIAADSVAAGVTAQAAVGPITYPVGFDPRFVVFGNALSEPFDDSPAAGTAFAAVGVAAHSVSGGTSQGHAWIRGANGGNPSQNISEVTNDSVVGDGLLTTIANLTVTGWPANGFALTADGALNANFGWFAVGCAEDAIVDVRAVTAGDGDKTVAGLVFEPGFLLRGLGTNPTVNTQLSVPPCGALSWAGVVAARGSVAGWSSLDAANPTQTFSIAAAAGIPTAALMAAATGAVERSGVLASFNADGWTETFGGGAAADRFGVVLAVQRNQQILSSRKNLAYRGERSRRERRRVA